MIAKHRWKASLIAFAFGGLLGGVCLVIHHLEGFSLVPLAIALFVAGMVVAEAVFYLIAKRFQFGLVLRGSLGQQVGAGNSHRAGQ